MLVVSQQKALPPQFRVRAALCSTVGNGKTGEKESIVLLIHSFSQSFPNIKSGPNW